MDSYDNLCSSHNYSPLTTLDDGQKDGQAHQLTQLGFSDTSTHPPGAEIIRPTTSDHAWQADNSSLRPPTGSYYDYSSPESSPLSFYDQSDGSSASISVPSPSHSISPAPRPSHVFGLRPSFLQPKPRNPSTSRSTPDTPNDKSRGSRSAHSRNSSQQWIPPTVQGGRGSPLVAGSYAGAYQSTPTVPEKSESAQQIPFPVPMIATSFTPPGAQYQVPVLGPAPGSSSLKRRSSEIGNTLDVQSAQKFDPRTEYFENQRPIPNACTGTPHHQWPVSSPATSGTQCPATGHAYVDVIPGLSPSLTHRGSVISLNPADTSGLQDELYGISSILPGSASSGASQLEAHDIPQRGTSSAVPEAQRNNYRIGKRKQPVLKNRPMPNAYPQYTERSGPPLATRTPSAQYPAVGSPYMAPEPSFHPHRGSVTSLNAVGSLLSPSSSGFQDNFVGAPTFSGPASDGPSQTADNNVPGQGTSSGDPEAPRKRRRTGERKRATNPKDPRATNRLRIQRKTEDENIEEIYRMVVPHSEESVAKKDRLSLIVRYLKQKSSVTRDSAREYPTSTEHGLENWSTLLSSQGGSTHGEPQPPRAEDAVNQDDVEGWCLLGPLMKTFTTGVDMDNNDMNL